MVRTVALTLAVMMSVVSCAFRMGDLQLVSGKNVSLSPEPVTRSVEGKDCVHYLLGLIPITGFVPNIEEAMDRAMESTPEGNVLTDVVIYNESLYAILFTQQCFRVKGDVGILR